MRTSTAHHRRFLALAVVALAACSSSVDSVVTPSSIAIGLSAGSASVVQGASTPLTVTITRTNFTGDVQLSAENLPANVTASFNPGTLSGSAGTSTLTIAASASATGGGPITVRAKGTGVSDATSTVSVAVAAAPAYTLALGNPTNPIAQGASATVDVTLTRANFTGAVTFAVSGLPAGATGSFLPASTTTDASVLTIATGAAAAGTYTLTITGTATGLANRTASLALTIASTGAPVNVAYTFCGNSLPIWVGYQSGTSGPWTTASVGAGNSYSFAINGVGAVAYVMESGGNAAANGYETSIQYGTATELQGSGAGTCLAPSAPKSISSKVLGMTIGSHESFVAVGYANTAVTTSQFILTGIPDGAVDLVASRHSLGGNAVPDKVIIRRGLNPVTGSTLPDIDFATQGVATTQATLTVTGLGGVPMSADVEFSTQNQTMAKLSNVYPSAAGTATYAGVPTSSLVAGDGHDFVFSVSDGFDSRYLVTYYREVADRTIAMSPTLPTPSFSTVATTPYARISASLGSQTAYDGGVLLSYAQGSSTGHSPADRYLWVQASAGYFGGTPATWNITIPDMSAATGFNTSWGLSGSTLTYYFLLGFGGVPANLGADGTSLAYAMKGGNFTSSPSMSAAQPRLAVSPSRPSPARLAEKKQQALQLMNARMHQPR